MVAGVVALADVRRQATDGRGFIVGHIDVDELSELLLPWMSVAV